MNRGQFLELSIPSDDVSESLEFYRRLGFTELPVNDIRDHYYAVVTDGRIAIGLHGGGFHEPALSFVWPDVARHARDLEEAGHELTIVELGIDEFHEAGLYSPDAHVFHFMEARTFSRRRFADAAEPLPGRSAEIALRCSDYNAAIAFWAHADFVADDDTIADADTDLVTLLAPGVVLGLRAGLRWPEPSLQFRPDDMETTRAELDRRDIAYRRTRDGWLITTPEGTRLLLVETS